MRDVPFKGTIGARGRPHRKIMHTICGIEQGTHIDVSKEEWGIKTLPTANRLRQACEVLNPIGKDETFSVRSYADEWGYNISRIMKKNHGNTKPTETVPIV